PSHDELLLCEQLQSRGRGDARRRALGGGKHRSRADHARFLGTRDGFPAAQIPYTLALKQRLRHARGFRNAVFAFTGARSKRLEATRRARRIWVRGAEQAW